MLWALKPIVIFLVGFVFVFFFVFGLKEAFFEWQRQRNSPGGFEVKPAEPLSKKKRNGD